MKKTNAIIPLTTTTIRSLFRVGYHAGGHTDIFAATQGHWQLLFWRFYNKKTLAVRKGNDKLIRKNGQSDGELFDLSNDLRESNNIADQKQSTASGLSQEVDDWVKEMKPPAYPGLGTWLKK